MAEERDEAGVLQAVYEHGQELGPLRLRRPATATLAQQTRYFVGDGQDSTRQLLDSSGQVKDSYFYDSFGIGLGGGQGTSVNAFRYTGQQLDNSGLYYLRARYYDAGSGRFLSHDPLMGSSDDPDSMHRYLYSSTDPVNNVDPSGRSDFSMGGMMTAMSMHNSLQSMKADVDTGIYEGVADMFGFDATSEGLAAHFINEYTGTNLSGGDIRRITDIAQSFGSVRRGGGGRGGSIGGYQMMKPRKGKKAIRRYRFQFAKALKNLDDDDDGRECFVAGTPVVLADGTRKSIEKIKKGDIVLSRDEKTGKTQAKKVVRTFEKQAPATLVLRFKGNQKIETTEEHPFYVSGKGFVKAGELGIGTSIVTRAGPSAELVAVERKNAPATVYNFEVEDFHTYFVGDGLWVHNDCKQIALGIENHLEAFSSAIGVPHYDDLSKLTLEGRRDDAMGGAVAEEIETMMYEAANNCGIHVNLQDADINRQYNPGFKAELPQFDGEIYLILADPDLYEKTTFYNGPPYVVVDKPAPLF